MKPLKDKNPIDLRSRKNLKKQGYYVSGNASLKWLYTKN